MPDVPGAFPSALKLPEQGSHHPLPRPARSEEWEELLRWLDSGLRGGRSHRLGSEYPLSRADAGDHWIVREDGQFVSHAWARSVVAVSGDVDLPLGMIGLVYTNPGERGRGLAGACLEACIEDLAGRGALLAVLWSEKQGFYARHEFAPAGIEIHLRLDRSVCDRAIGDPSPDLDVGDPRPSDWPLLERAYAQKRARALRAAGHLQHGAAAPDCEVVVARRGDEPCAYVALGRGDDFPGVVHEWAGDPEGVLVCLRHLLSGRKDTGREDVGRREIGILTDRLDQAPMDRLRESSARTLAGRFGLVRILDGEALWKRVRGDDRALADTRLEGRDREFCVSGRSGDAVLKHDELLKLCFAGVLPVAAPKIWNLEERSALLERLPLPLYLWGFDSI